MPKGSVPSLSRICPDFGNVVRGMHRKADKPLALSISCSSSALLREPQRTKEPNSIF